MAAALGAVVGIYYDGARPLAPGEALRTPTGRTYLVVDVRVQARGRHVGRQHLRCAVVDQLDAGTVIHPLYWYKRARRRLVDKSRPG